jgi:dTDP-4-dehydrorhamnose 3,5-epimerase
MHISTTSLDGVLLLTPSLSKDQRGCFFESFNKKQLENHIRRPMDFLQENQSRSVQGVIRGLHYQVEKPQGKLIRASWGRIFDVVVDITKKSSTFGRWLGVEISEENHRQIWIPPGFAHGFLVLSSLADVVYKTTDYWYPEHERCICWNDPTIGIDWPIDKQPILSEKDSRGEYLANAEVYE